MTDDPFANGETPVVIAVAEGYGARCPCGWVASAALSDSKPEATQALEAHLRIKHPDYKGAVHY